MSGSQFKISRSAVEQRSLISDATTGLYTEDLTPDDLRDLADELDADETDSNSLTIITEVNPTAYIQRQLREADSVCSHDNAVAVGIEAIQILHGINYSASGDYGPEEWQDYAADAVDELEEITPERTPDND